jgi:hypothetical protein
MKGGLFAVAALGATLAVAGCGGSEKEVSAASLRPRLLPTSVVLPFGFALQRTQDWSDPVNLVGEGFQIPQRTRPSEAVGEFTGAHLEGSAGETFTRGGAMNQSELVVGVAKFASAADAERVRDWMHRENLKQPCYSQCIFAPASVTLHGLPGVRLAVQSAKAPVLPPGAPPQAKAHPPSGPANYGAEFTVGPYLYWAGLRADSRAQSRFEQGVKLYYARAQQQKQS